MKRYSSVIIRHFSTARNTLTANLCCLLLAGLLCPTSPAAAEVLLSCPGGAGGDWNIHGFYVPEYPGVTLDSARLRLSASASYPGTYMVMLTVRSDSYDGAILGFATNTVSLSFASPQYATFSFPSLPTVKNGRLCFILTVLSGPAANVYYDVGGGCPEVVETTDTVPPLSTFNRYGVNLQLTGRRLDPEVLVACPGAMGDFYSHGFYVSQYPGITLDSATLKMAATVTGTYQVAMTVFSNMYDGPILAAATNQVAFSGLLSDAVPVVWTFPATPIEKYSRVCFRLSLISGPSTAVYYAVGDGCNSVIETEGTTPPLDTFRRDGVDVTIVGENDPAINLRLDILQKPSGVFLMWNSFSGHTYTIETNAALHAFNVFQTEIVATPPGNSLGPLPISPLNALFYRLVQKPVALP